jgi:hypothetical protein
LDRYIRENKEKEEEEEKYLITISNPPLVGNLNANTRDVNVSMEKIVLCLWICETLIAQKKRFLLRSLQMSQQGD